jgi:hypothetical protein
MISGVFSLISPLLPTATRAKIQILTASDTPDALAKEIEASELPTFLGGSKPDAECAVAAALPVPTDHGLGPVDVQ